MTRYYLLIPALIVVLAACGRDDTDVAAPDEIPTIVDEGAGAMYAYVPADTAAVFGNLDRVPDDVLDAWWAQMEPIMPFYAQMAEDEDMPEAMRAYFGLLSHFSDRESFEAMGLRADALAVVYMDGLYPHLRLEFGDRDALLATLEEYSREGGIQWRYGDIDGRQYRWLPTEEDKPAMPALALAVNEDHLAVGWIPRTDERLGHLVGTALPEEAIRVADLRRFNHAHGYTPYGSGYFDLVRFSELLLDANDPDAQHARAAFDLEALAANPACRAEITALVSHFPRMIFGMPDFRADHLSMHGRIETSNDLGGRLASLVNLPLGLGSDAGGVFNFGVGLNIVNARDAARHYVDAWVANPPQCPTFNNIAENAAEWQVQLNRPVPPVFTNIQGFRALVTELELDGDDWDARGVATLSMSNPQLLVGMAAMFSPELAELDLRPDGEPRAVPPELFQGMLDAEAWIAMSDSAVALAVGEGLESQLSAALERGAVDGTLMSYGVDYHAYMDLINTFMERIPDEDEDMTDMKSLFSALGDLYDRSFFSIRLSIDGIDFVTTADLKD